jgi:hypothetical protein
VIGPVMAAELLPGDALQEHDWAGIHSLHVTYAREGDWTDNAGALHHGMVVGTRELGPLYERHFALAETVTVEREL